MHLPLLKKTIGFGCALLSLQCSDAWRREEGAVFHDIRDVMLRDKNSYFYLDAAAYPRHDRTLPIGVFDSGTGGLTVLDAIVRLDAFNNDDHRPDEDGDGRRDFQSERFIYLGDQANMPYGEYAAENNLSLLIEHIFKDLQFLLGNRYYPTAQSRIPAVDKSPVKAVVIACNTATAYGKEEIERFLKRADLPVKVIGVIDAGVTGALDCFAPSADGTIAVMATPGTVASNGYPRALQAQMAALGYHGCIQLFQQPGFGLAGAIDGAGEFISLQAVRPRAGYQGPSFTHPQARIDSVLLHRYGFDWTGHRMLYHGELSRTSALQINSIDNYIAHNLCSLLEQVRKARVRHPLKVLILGCTHYPFYLKEFKARLAYFYNYQEQGEYLYRPYMAETIHLVDPSIHTAWELYEYLRAEQLFNAGDQSASEFYLSVANQDNPEVQCDEAGNFTWRYKYGRRAGAIQEYVKIVPFSQSSFSIEIYDRLKKTIPAAFELIDRFSKENSKRSRIP
ncbi:MAG TPA: Asp/Glu/hydantoin racemase [bacterium]|nr:Asp/Glu/hydantoin racemase [bacterium]HPN35210.1 Asp/Glu/hydantoin racemase [bacterium]